MELRIEDFFDEFIDVFHFSVDVFLEHAETFGCMENFEGCYPAKVLHIFVT